MSDILAELRALANSPLFQAPRLQAIVVDLNVPRESCVQVRRAAGWVLLLHAYPANGDFGRMLGTINREQDFAMIVHPSVLRDIQPVIRTGRPDVDLFSVRVWHIDSDPAFSWRREFLSTEISNWLATERAAWEAGVSLEAFDPKRPWAGRTL